jgi:hypothetical protein
LDTPNTAEKGKKQSGTEEARDQDRWGKQPGNMQERSQDSNQERISNLMLLKDRLVLREGLAVYTVGLRITHLKNVERNLLVRCVL